MKVKSVSRLDKPYEGGDTFMEWHKEKTKSIPHDVDYATPIWRCESENERGLRMAWAGIVVVAGIGLAYVFAYAFIDWLKS
jgi:hypothetical protein